MALQNSLVQHILGGLFGILSPWKILKQIVPPFRQRHEWQVGERIHIITNFAHEGKAISLRAEMFDHCFEDFKALVAVAEQGHLFDGGHAVAQVRRIQVMRMGGEGDHIRRRKQPHEQG